MNFRHFTRLKILQVWFAVVLLVAVAAIALGVSVTIGTGALLLAVCLVPPAVLLMLWPSDSPTMAESIRDAKLR
jgi:hypothetical protein